MTIFRCLLAVALFYLAELQAGADELTIISPHWEGIRYEFANAFSEYYQGQYGKPIHITWLDVGGTSEILRYIRSEYQRSPSGVGIDLLFGGGIDPFIELKRAALLEPAKINLAPEVAREVAGTPLHDPDGYFFAATMSVFGIICNQEVLRRLNLEPPRTWEDLGTPELRGWIGSGDPRRSGSMHMAYEIMLQAYGWERGWQAIYRLGANIRSFVANSLQVSKDVSNGEVACGLAIDSQASSQLRSLEPGKLTFTIPTGLSVINGDAIALLKGAPHPDIAREFLRFILSEAGQRIWMLPVGSPGGPRSYELARFSVLPHLYAKVPRTGIGLNPFEQQSSLRYNSTLGSSRWGLLNDLFGVYVVDGQQVLRQSIPTSPPLPEATLATLTAAHPPLSPLDRAHLIHDWETAAYQHSWPRLGLQLVPTFLVIMILFLCAHLNRRATRRRSTIRSASE